MNIFRIIPIAAEINIRKTGLNFVKNNTGKTKTNITKAGKSIIASLESKYAVDKIAPIAAAFAPLIKDFK